MNKKGFTLVELLAVIIILAVIALVTVPQVLKLIESSRRNAFIDSAYGIIESGNFYYVRNIDSNSEKERYDFEVENNQFVLKDDKTKKLDFKGSMPKSGTLQLHSNGDTAIAICDRTYCACKSVSESKVILKEENCNINEETGEIGKEDSIAEARFKELEAKVKNLETELVASKKRQVKAGTIISYMGKAVPEGYLACDGKTYNINDYKELAEQIKSEFGSYSHFGGDGTKTFAVPDLRGEFLRGTGTASRDTGSGADVGVHQDPTKHLNIVNYNGIVQVKLSSGNSASSQNVDSWSSNLPRATNLYSNDTFSENATGYYTSRPTNTSVLYAIKY